MSKIQKISSLNEFFELHEMQPKKSLLYIEALTHSSANKPPTKVDGRDYEKLEFLGDAVLQFLTSAYIYSKYSHLDSGAQTRLRAKVVCTEALSTISKELGLVDILKTGPGQMEKDVKESQKVQADIFESVIGAIYADLGISQAKKFAERYVFPIIDAEHNENNKDAKTELQEFFQGFSKQSIQYVVESLPDRTFKAKVIHENKVFGEGYGLNKKEAELNAAKAALEKQTKG
ncbi:ribonuclease III [Mycoplasma corogypsi]|uniref:ribonuclease III n=1 Tax=Mycoplasma corogypsi TaxID=2106 RepID=UPI0038734F3F